MADNLAAYVAVPEYWTDVPEAEPRCRVRSLTDESYPVHVTAAPIRVVPEVWLVMRACPACRKLRRYCRWHTPETSTERAARLARNGERPARWA